MITWNSREVYYQFNWCFYDHAHFIGCSLRMDESNDFLIQFKLKISHY
jgi:hypothetical protein